MQYWVVAFALPKLLQTVSIGAVDSAAAAASAVKLDLCVDSAMRKTQTFSVRIV
jgi:hypothetical protein